MYEFIDTDKHQSSWKLSSVAMHFNGRYIEDEIRGYRTLNVTGREFLGINLNTADVRNGTITLDHRLPGRELEIEFELQARNNAEFQRNFQLLRAILATNEEVPVTFNDEPHITYFARLSGIGDIPPHTNHVTGSFFIHSDSPYKFGPPVVTDGEISIDTVYDTPPAFIRLTVGNTTNLIEITNGEQTIILDGNFNSGSVITMDVEKGRIWENGTDRDYIVRLNSDFENFMVQQGQTVTSNQGTLEITCRERWL